MSTQRLDSEIKTRLPSGQKKALEQIAEVRHLDTADIVREALRQYLERNKSSQGKAVPA